MQIYAQFLGQGRTKEVFFLNLEDGYFGCQVNESTEVLQLFDLSKLCDGVSSCFKSADENIRELKCTSKFLLFFFHLKYLLHLGQAWKNTFMGYLILVLILQRREIFITFNFI